MRNPGRGSEKPDSTRGSFIPCRVRDWELCCWRPSSKWPASVLLSPCGRRERYSCVLVTSGQGLGDRMSGRGGLFLPLSTINTAQSSHFYRRKIFIVIFNAICAVSIMIPSMAAGSVVTLFGSAQGLNDVIILGTQRTLCYSVCCDFRPPVSALVSCVYCRLQARAEYLVGNISLLSVTNTSISHL